MSPVRQVLPVGLAAVLSLPACDPATPDYMRPIDADRDGWDSTVDCDDTDPAMNLDDADGDGSHSCGGDCDDADPDLNITDADGDGSHTCGGDCDDADPAVEALDADGDGIDTCSGDCDDADDSVFPGAGELCDDGIDSDCDGSEYCCGISLSLSDAKWIGEEESLAGISVASARDVDGDGLDDVIVGAWMDGEAGYFAGAAYLLLGPASGTHGMAEAEAKFTGEASGDGAGLSVSAGDVDGDGLGDLLVGAPQEDSGGDAAGAVYLLYGPISGSYSLALADAKLVGEAEDDWAGYSVAGAGDVDGDGLDDLLVGAPGADGGGQYGGAVYLVYGAVSGVVELVDADATLFGGEGTFSAGWSVASAGDLDGDGLDDILVGAPSEDTHGHAAGAVYVVRGPVHGSFDLADADAKLVGVTVDGMAGWSVASAGDTDGDGYDDVLLGAPGGGDNGYWHAGTAYLFHGPLSGVVDVTQADASFTGEGGEDAAGWALSAAGDVDGDGNSDVVIAAWGNDTGGEHAGAVYLFFGPVSGEHDVCEADAKLVGESDHASAGRSVARAGDVDGNGHGDLIIGAYSEQTGGNNAGAVYLVYAEDLP